MKFTILMSIYVGFRPVLIGEVIMRRIAYRALFTGAVLGACLSFQAAAAQEVLFAGDPCPLSIRETIDDQAGTETGLSSFTALGLVNNEVLVISYDDDKIGYVSMDEIREKVPALTWQSGDVLPAVTDFENLENGSEGDLVKEVQQILEDLGLSAGGVDGMYGAGTAGSVSAFQESAGLEATGIVDAVTWFTMQDEGSGSGPKALSVSYPPDLSREGKFQMIIDHVDDLDYLNQFLDPEWILSYDLFAGQGRIDYTSEGLSLGTMETGAIEIDRVTFDLTAYVRLHRGEHGAVLISPVIEVKAEGSHRPYISGAVMTYGVFSEKMSLDSQECVLDDRNCLETTLLSLSPQVYKLLQAKAADGKLELQLSGLEKTYKIDLTPYLEEFSAFMDDCYNVPLKDEEEALELTYEDEEELEEEDTEEEQTESEDSYSDVDTGAAAYDSAIDVLTPQETEISDYTGESGQTQQAGDEYALDAGGQSTTQDTSSDATASDSSDIDMALSGSDDTAEE